MKKCIVLIGLCLCLTSCGFKEVNDQIAKSNVSREKAFQTAMVAAAKTESPSDDIAIAMAYASNMGQQAFIKPETFLDYANGFLPYANLAYVWWGGGSRKKSSNTAGRDIYINSSRGESWVDLMNGSGSTNFSMIPSE